MTNNETSKDLEAAVKETADYLYNIKGDVTAEQYLAIDRLRQLINEEFIGKDKTVSSQFIYDIISPAFKQTLQAGGEK